MAENVCTSIIEHFSTLPDPRFLLKTSHKLVDIVAMALCAVVAGADDWVEIAAYARAKEAWFKGFLELPGGIPSHDTLGRVFALFDPDTFGKCYVDWVRSLINLPDELVAVDGKTLHRSHDRSNGKSAIHMVNAWAVHHGLVLAQVKTEAKSNEITAIPELLKLLDPSLIRNSQINYGYSVGYTCFFPAAGHIDSSANRVSRKSTHNPYAFVHRFRRKVPLKYRGLQSESQAFSGQEKIEAQHDIRMPYPRLR